MLQRYRAVIVVAATILLLAMLSAVFAIYVRNKHAWAESTLAEIEPRYARLKGIVLSEAALRAASADVKKNVEMSVYPSSLDVDRASSELQQRAKKIFENAGMTVVTSRIVEPKQGKNFDVLSVSFSVNGGLAGLQSALAIIRQEAPLLKVDDFLLQPLRRQLQSDPEVVLCVMTISALRNRP